MRFDAHAHLPEHGFSGVPEDFQGVVCTARPADFLRLAELAAARPGVIPAFGIHPWFARDFTDETCGVLREFLEKTPRAEIGEIGLDKARASDVPLAIQRAVFERQLALAAEKSVPAHIHCVRAWGEMTEILRRVALPPRLHFHAFSGSAEIARELLRLGNATFSFLPRQRERLTAKLLRVFEIIPAERIFEESDAPADIFKTFPRLI